MRCHVRTNTACVSRIRSLTALANELTLPCNQGVQLFYNVIITGRMWHFNNSVVVRLCNTRRQPSVCKIREVFSLCCFLDVTESHSTFFSPSLTYSNVLLNHTTLHCDICSEMLSHNNPSIHYLSTPPRHTGPLRAKTYPCCN